jgi:hypothetical protein
MTSTRVLVGSSLTSFGRIPSTKWPHKVTTGPVHGKRISREGPACFAVAGMDFTLRLKQKCLFREDRIFARNFRENAKINIFVSTLLYTPISMYSATTVRTAT